MKLIDVSTKKMPNTFAKVDDEDFDFLNQWKWSADIDRRGATIYATRQDRSGPKFLKISMHRLVMQTPKDMQTDHVDRDGLNNQRSNLRICTRAQNQMNQKMRGGASRFRGVSFEKSSGKWIAELRYRAAPHSKRMRIKTGRYQLEVDAARAWNEAALRIFGAEFVRLNEIPE